MTSSCESALEPAFFDGRLRQHGAGWCWSDGTAEARVGLLPARQVALPYRPAPRDGWPELVEVPVLIAHAYDPLRWLLHGWWTSDDAWTGARADRMGSAASCASGIRFLPPPLARRQALVPLERWRAWCGEARWYPLLLPGDAAGVLTAARRRGWRADAPAARYAAAG